MEAAIQPAVAASDAQGRGMSDLITADDTTCTALTIVKPKRRRNAHKWTVAEIHILMEYADAPREQLMALFPHSKWAAIAGAMQRYCIHRQNNVPHAKAPRPLKVLQDLTDARVSRRLPMKCIEAKVGSLLTYLEPGQRDPSFRKLLKWCDALGLELRALPKGVGK